MNRIEQKKEWHEPGGSCPGNQSQRMVQWKRSEATAENEMDPAGGNREGPTSKWTVTINQPYCRVFWEEMQDVNEN